MIRLPPLLLLLPACGAETLAQSWQLDRLRVLAVAAEPAEPRPGDTVSFTSLVYTPTGVSLAGTVWFACLPQSADEFGCTLDPALLDALQVDPSALSPDELAELVALAQEAGLIGFEPGFAPRWPVPADALDALPDAARAEGLSAIINVTALPESASGATLDPAEVEAAYKRVPVSLAATPNHNPAVDGVDIEPAVAPQDGLHAVQPGATYTLTPRFPDSAIEEYVFINEDGAEESRTEEPYFTWYAEGGTFDQPFSLYPTSDVEWTAPDAGFEGWVLVVMRDRRGGMAWSGLRLSTGEAR
jgi:hypothetical protein